MRITYSSAYSAASVPPPPTWAHSFSTSNAVHFPKKTATHPLLPDPPPRPRPHPPPPSRPHPHPHPHLQFGGVEVFLLRQGPGRVQEGGSQRPLVSTREGYDLGRDCALCVCEGGVGGWVGCSWGVSIRGGGGGGGRGRGGLGVSEHAHVRIWSYTCMRKRRRRRWCFVR